MHVDFPASSPHALACGGTTVQLDAANTPVSETVWNDGAGRGATGGGVSDTFPLPPWQGSVGVPNRAGGGTGRGVPDVAGDADPATGYRHRPVPSRPRTTQPGDEPGDVLQPSLAHCA